MRIAVFQSDPKLAQVEENRTRIRDGVLAADADLAVFPECALTGYAFDSRADALALAETIPGPTTEEIAAACASAGVFALFGLLERDGERLYNAAALVGPEGLVGRYRKMHLLHLGVDRFTDPGDLGFPVFQTPHARIGVLICFDLSFPEAARVLKLEGAQVLCVPTNWPLEARVSCDFAPPTRAQENHLNIVCANRSGEEGGFTFRGCSRILDYDARVLAEAGAAPATIRARIDPEAADHNRIVHRPGTYELDRIAARRPRFYGPVARDPDRASRA